MPKPGSLMGLFRNQTFAMLWFASLASNFGGLVQAVGGGGSCAAAVLAV